MVNKYEEQARYALNDMFETGRKRLEFLLEHYRWNIPRPAALKAAQSYWNKLSFTTKNVKEYAAIIQRTGSPLSTEGRRYLEETVANALIKAINYGNRKAGR